MYTEARHYSSLVRISAQALVPQCT
ncbi:hypothetical protein CFIMG_004749RA [Ceratocystis fimbriata CBS 114723]|uniref:Uncharacterized protein n=1 Tax=Ceratocystis fimbriata CBS 114723 TaxID=1035309 RepID=A0A2C5WXU4_9PEZI|nr:hypothetical protein CFIMG_004749RA [Ceratocystis fimbriata CBS 114723]